MHANGPGLLKVDVRRGRETSATYLMNGKPRHKPQTTLDCNRTDDYRVLSLAKQWLNTCLAEHDACNRRSHPTSGWHLPTRLVKVTGFMTKVSSLKLCLGKDIAPGTKYMTLSHCWGGADIVKLTAGTLEQFQTEIPLPDLPKNFKDAASVTLFMGYEYLWIDSLCIIQDSIEDWGREAGTMGNVYRYSICTIAAAAATNPHDGFFVERDARSFTPCQIVPTGRNGRGVYAENWRDRLGRETLHTRGWVCQESALSPRTLYFRTRMVDWNCTMASAVENDTEMATWTQRPGIKQDFYQLLDKSRGEYTSWSSAWWSIIAEYTKCNLTFDKDRWPAIMGLATAVETQSGRRLVHGLWEANLPVELMWKISNPLKGKRLESEAPSWSWLGWTSPVHKMGYNLNGYFRMDAAVALQTHPLDRTKIFVRGRMAKLKWTVKYSGDGHREYCYRFLCDERHQIQGVWDGQWAPDIVPEEGWDIWSLEFVTDDRVKEAAGLVVRRQEQSSDIAWTRVGTYSLLPYASRGDDPAWNVPKIQSITLT
ncbi:heterokaryon incompatibility protein-domain-containing protein [Xylaria arbuscula]|nr:heterokaryon incompatibility protein-domain-containing protein [Xylaria arbuscula]